MRLAFGLGVALLTTSAALAAGDAPGARAAARALLPPELAPQLRAGLAPIDLPTAGAQVRLEPRCAGDPETAARVVWGLREAGARGTRAVWSYRHWLDAERRDARGVTVLTLRDPRRRPRATPAADDVWIYLPERAADAAETPWTCLGQRDVAVQMRNVKGGQRWELRSAWLIRLPQSEPEPAYSIFYVDRHSHELLYGFHFDTEARLRGVLWSDGRTSELPLLAPDLEGE